MWEQPPTRSSSAAAVSVSIDVNRVACDADGVPVLRRASGGGTVLLGPGCLCFSLVLSYEHAPRLNEIPAINRYILARIAKALTPVRFRVGGRDERPRGQRREVFRQRPAAKTELSSSTTARCCAASTLRSYRNTSTHRNVQPDYRRARAHAEFVANLPLSVEEAKRLLIAEWQPEGDYSPVPLEHTRELCVEKYTRRVEP